MWAKDIHRDWSSVCPNPKSRANFPNFCVNSYGCGEAPGVIAICSKWCVAGGRRWSMYRMLQGRRSVRVLCPGGWWGGSKGGAAGFPFCPEPGDCLEPPDSELQNFWQRSKGEQSWSTSTHSSAPQPAWPAVGLDFSLSHQAHTLPAPPELL